MIVDNLNQIKVAAFRNSIRLFRDACILALYGSRETSYAIAILAYEEIGKMAIADRQLDRICLNPGSEDYAVEDFSQISRKHIPKQWSAAFDSGNPNLNKIGTLDVQKQNALYTDIRNNNVLIPSISKKKLIEFIKEVYRALNEIGDLAYNGIHALSTEKSEWQAQSDISSIKSIYEQVISL